MLGNLKVCLEHNFFSAVLLMGAGIMCFHYQKLIVFLRFCPQVMAVGPPSTGKTISLQAALSFFDANNCKYLYKSCSKAYCLQRSAISTIPFRIDDPNLDHQSHLARTLSYPFTMERYQLTSAKVDYNLLRAPYTVLTSHLAAMKGEYNCICITVMV